ncbi:NADH-quinone oxidoreductase subunit NuoH [Cytophaga hutchinsonii]|jgi:NADH-quinone oxidoreductase subunit H|uniref:NADH-quinone oxidoreductase subunit H 1 n=1 Tax=Cytophaga hutchinsonii (strain ATCC 33406 / DSM 1761 / CIP 103989 / NBRC 15051 / NCIMB 9469 / D465) TaxID=269798 RepID=NUOH1_CYTH3|nr:NADH-quinone oxidoreductase subunit NuoH [Cytophaga hutchinsonii]Q11VB9.1 RecName: Full=NADH-quinone oxidoreductase subunit H 1; AltName: Full=NADH dehydrogenase I subunit H 1; AltName: Full=NDH-1 subunit H 1 [Cytophaga hutchinsonii ATCC 33406]ABG58647.1 NADH dehydrogenase subunit H [Cytophaga hutchinsonii ATCC 33406]SFX58763.1 NADH dehydrogenase subunit H [Cytophaga hutchinsonii ATCC 33406]
MEIPVEFLLEKTIIVTAVFTISLVIAMYSTYAERKVSALLQDRIGPNRAGPFGLLQPLADGVKFFMKEEIIPSSANKALFILGPSIAMMTACLTGAVIPWGSYLEIGGDQIALQVTDINIGVLYIFAVVSIGVYGVMIGGWASNNKFSLMGAIRASSQMISYEIAMGLSIIALVMTTGTLSIGEIVQQQTTDWWNIVYQPLGFFIFMVCSFAECNRTPFDLPECEAELIGGYHTEYSSMKLGLYLFAEYINMFISSAVMSAFYFGGYDIPYIETLGLDQNTVTILGTLFFFTKIVLFIFLFMWVRWTLPRFRYDQLMNLGWKIMIPMAIINIIITGACILLF